jgi:hypothetical protein
MRSSLALACLVVPSLLAPAAVAAPPAEGVEFFEKKVRPVLVEHCYRCHSEESGKRRGGLALDTRDDVLKGGDNGPAVVPGKPDASLLIQAVRYTEAGAGPKGTRMPPRGKLPDAVVADLEKWVEMGAPDPREARAAKKGIDVEVGRKFWAFRAPRRQTPPDVKDRDWPRIDLDRYVLSRLEAAGLHPVADADRATLLRRAYFDLVGLPPTPEQIDAFVNDPSPDAWEKVVDGLLASPAYGERWGRHWLDVARFAESSGGGRSLLFKDAWRYRDYVIDSFNADKPYDRFVKEQIAGDLLPSDGLDQRREQLVAVAFLALGPTNYEEQVKETLEMDVVDEQLDTIGRAFLGMTIGCARCHDHKFDPIPTKDYYALAGIFRSTQTLIHDNVSRWVDNPLPLPPGQEAALKEHEAAVAALKEKIARAKTGGKPAEAAKGVVAVADLPGIVLDDSQAKKVGEWTLSKYSGSFIGDGYLHDGNADKGKKTLTFVPDIPKSGKYEVRLAYTPGSNRSAKVPVHVLHLDGEYEGFVNEQEVPAIDGRFVSLGTFRFEKGTQWYVLVSNAGTTGHVVVDAVQFLPEELTPATKEGDRAAGDVKKLEEELKKLTDAGPERPAAMGVKEAAKVGDAFVCVRGNVFNRGEVVPRGFLQVATAGKPPTIPTKESGRRELAEWLAGADNPLTARVMVNRVWHHLFGAGIVRTVDVFGTTGELPSHPELLDYLAVRFVEEGWSVKQLVRAILLSRAYRLGSGSQAEALAADPENRLVWRQNRRRLEAEALRDAMLAVSGQLDRAVGGPTVRPGTASEYGYAFDETRRSVYLPVFRNRLPELFEAFDFPDPNLVGGRRNASTVATQALLLMNGPFVLDQARHAARVTEGMDDAARVERAYRVALGRPPTGKEREVALGFVRGAKEGKRAASWERFYQALFGSIDFRYVE